MLRLLEKRAWLSWLGVFAFAIIIFILSSFSFQGSNVAKTSSFSVFYHFLVFFWLGFFLVVALVKGKNKKYFILAIVIATVYSLSDEIHQLFVPNRNFAISDILTDYAGILFANLLYLISFRKV